MTNPTLTDIKGIGPAMAQKLQAQGITVAKLATMTTQQLVTVPSVGLASAKVMIASAQVLLDGTTQEGAKPVAQKPAASAKPAAQKAVKKAPEKTNKKSDKKADKKDKKAAKKADKKKAKKAGKKAVKKPAKKKKKKSSSKK